MMHDSHDSWPSWRHTGDRDAGSLRSGRIRSAPSNYKKYICFFNTRWISIGTACVQKEKIRTYGHSQEALSVHNRWIHKVNFRVEYSGVYIVIDLTMPILKSVKNQLFRGNVPNNIYQRRANPLPLRKFNYLYVTPAWVIKEICIKNFKSENFFS